MLEICRNCWAWNGLFLQPKAACKRKTEHKNWNDSCEEYRDNPKLLHSNKKQDGYQPERAEVIG